MCTPELGATMGVVLGESRERIESVKGPVALMTPFARTSNSAVGAGLVGDFGEEGEEEKKKDFLTEEATVEVLVGGKQSRTLTPVILPDGSLRSWVTSMWFTTVAL